MRGRTVISALLLAASSAGLAQITAPTEQKFTGGNASDAGAQANGSAGAPADNAASDDTTPDAGNGNSTEPGKP